MLRHPGQAPAASLEGESLDKNTNNITMHHSHTKISKQQQSPLAEAPATTASEPKPMNRAPTNDGGAVLTPASTSTNTTAGMSMFSPPLAASTAPSTTIESVLASLSSGSSIGQSTTLHVVTPSTGDVEHKLSSPPLRRHPGAPLPRRVSDYLSSTDDDDVGVDFPTTVKVATAASAPEQYNEKAEVTADAFPGGIDTVQERGDFHFYSDGTFGVIEKKTDNKKRSKSKEAVNTKAKIKTLLGSTTSNVGEISKEEKSTKEKGTKRTKKAPKSKTAAINETKKGSGRFRVKFTFPGVGTRNVGTYASMEIAAYARASANRKHAQFKTSEDAFGTKDAVDQAMKAIRAHVKKALLNRQRAIDLQRLITKKTKAVDVSTKPTNIAKGVETIVENPSKTKEADEYGSNKSSLFPSTPPVVERRVPSDKINTLLPNGISLLPSSGHYQVSIFFLGEERKVGVYDSLVAATAANDAVKNTLRSYLLKRSVMNGVCPDSIDADTALEAARKAANAKIAILEECTPRNLPLKKRLLDRSLKEFSLPLKKRVVEDGASKPTTAMETTEKSQLLLPLKKRLLRAVPVSNPSAAGATPFGVIYLDGTGPSDANKNTEDGIIYLDGTMPDKKPAGRICSRSDAIDDRVGGDKASCGDHGNVKARGTDPVHQFLGCGSALGNNLPPMVPMPPSVEWQPFPVNLMQLLSGANTLGAAGIVCECNFVWNPDGLSFMCFNPGKLIASAHCARFFNDLYAYGFTQNFDGSYFHPLFQRDNPQLCLRMEPSATARNFGTSYKPFLTTRSDASGIYYDVLIPRIDPMDGTSLFGFNFLRNRDNWTCISTHTGSLGPWLRNGDYIIDVNGQPMYTVCGGPVVSIGLGPGFMVNQQQQTMPLPLESVIKACNATELGYPLKLQIFRPHAAAC